MVVWISGASSGIGAALAASVPYEAAVFLHMSGVATPTGPVVDADVDGYTQAVLLNAASSQVLGKASLDGCRNSGTRATRPVLVPGRGDGRLRRLPLMNFSGGLAMH